MILYSLWQGLGSKCGSLTWQRRYKYKPIYVATFVGAHPDFHCKRKLVKNKYSYVFAIIFDVSNPVINISLSDSLFPMPILVMPPKIIQL